MSCERPSVQANMFFSQLRVYGLTVMRCGCRLAEYAECETRTLNVAEKQN